MSSAVVDGAALVPDTSSSEARAVLSAHGKSFRFAGAFLDNDRLDDAAVVYAFCRAVDDAVDEASSVEEARAAATALQNELAGEAPPRAVVRAFFEVARRRDIDVGYARELVTGVASDAVAAVRVEDDGGLLRYCYRVAGTVGGLMCGVLGVTEKQALPFAIDLGVAMQLTNICRDVLEDAEKNRRYLPQTRLHKEGGVGSVAAIVDGRDRDAVKAVVKDLLALAEVYYESGEVGLRFIPWRSRFGIFVAARLYRAIGRKLLRRGGDPLDGRVSTTLLEKLALATAATVSFFALPARGEHHAGLHTALQGLPGCDPAATR